MAVAQLDIILGLQNEFSSEFDKVRSKVQSVSGTIQASMLKVNRAFDRVKARLRSFADSYKKNWLSITAAVTASLLAIRSGFNLLSDAAGFEQQKEAFRLLAEAAGANADEVIRNLRRMAGETLSTADTIGIASKAIALGLAPENLPALMEIARKSARALGQDVSFMFNSLAEGIGKQQKLILDNTGIVFQAQTAYEEYAASIGTTAIQLTDAEKKQAFLSKTIEEGSRVFAAINTEMKTQLESIQSLQAAWADLRIKIGDMLLLTIQGLSLLGTALEISLFRGLTKIQTAIGDLSFKMAEFIENFESFSNRIPGVNANFDSLADRFRSFGETNKALADGFGDNADEFEKMAEEISNIINEKLNPDLVKMKNAMEALNKPLKPANKDTKVYKSSVEGLTMAFNELGPALAVAGQQNIAFARAAQAVALAMAIVNTAQGVSRAFKDYAWPFSAIVAGIVAAAGAIQVATIAAQKFHSGGIVRGGTLASDEVPIIAQTGEAFLSRRGVAALGGETNLNALNNGQSGGVRSSGDITITINNPRFNNREDIQELGEVLGDEIESQLTYARSI